MRLRAKRNCSTCQFWEPTLENAPRSLPAEGHCGPATTYGGESSQHATRWPASAVGGDGAQLLTLFSFSCAGWERSVTGAAGERPGRGHNRRVGGA
jgi:hypothetical protein